MRNKNLILILFLTVFIIPFNVFAAGGFDISTTKITLNPGQTKTVNINSNNAVGRLNILSSNNGVASVNPSSIFIQTPGASGSIKIVAKKVGTATISIVATNNFATMDEEKLTGQTKKITVNVVQKQVQPSTKNETKKPTTSNNKKNANESKKSTNNNLKEIKVDGYQLTKVSNNNYKLIVSNDVTSININAKAEDSKAKIVGNGNHNIKVGNNDIKIVITSESGIDNVINLSVNRKDSYYLDDLNSALNNIEGNDINIVIKKGDSLDQQKLLDIKKSGKKVIFNYYDDSKILRYSWCIDGSKITDESNLNFDVISSTSPSEALGKLSNYADGIYISFDNKFRFPKNTIIKVFVGDKYNDTDSINLYNYSNKNEKLNLVKENLKINNGYIEISLDDESQILITKSDLSLINKSEKSFNIFLYTTILEFIILVILVIYINRKNK